MLGFECQSNVLCAGVSPSGSPAPIPSAIQRMGKEGAAGLLPAGVHAACLPGHSINTRPVLHPLAGHSPALEPSSPPMTVLPVLGAPPASDNPLTQILRGSTGAVHGSMGAIHGITGAVRGGTPPTPSTPVSRSTNPSPARAHPALSAIPAVPSMPPLCGGRGGSANGCDRPLSPPLSPCSPAPHVSHAPMSLVWEPPSPSSAIRSGARQRPGSKEAGASPRGL